MGSNHRWESMPLTMYPDSWIWSDPAMVSYSKMAWLHIPPALGGLRLQWPIGVWGSGHNCQSLAFVLYFGSDIQQFCTNIFTFYDSHLKFCFLPGYFTDTSKQHAQPFVFGIGSICEIFVGTVHVALALLGLRSTLEAFYHWATYIQSGFILFYLFWSRITLNCSGRLKTCKLSASAIWVAGITGTHHHAYLKFVLYSALK